MGGCGLDIVVCQFTQCCTGNLLFLPVFWVIIFMSSLTVFYFNSLWVLGMRVAGSLQ